MQFYSEQFQQSQQSFNDYLSYLRDSIKALQEYWVKTGKKHPHVNTIKEGLNDKDPFIVHKASIAATLLLNNKKIYH